MLSADRVNVCTDTCPEFCETTSVFSARKEPLPGHLLAANRPPRTQTRGGSAAANIRGFYSLVPKIVP